jgi:hypothetical protein
MGDFPSMKWPKFRRVLTRKPLEYHLDHQSGSHGKYVSDAGYPELGSPSMTKMSCPAD